MKTEFAIGECVQIRSWEDMAREYDSNNGRSIIDLPGYFFAAGMKHLCGKKGHISHISEFNRLGHNGHLFSFYDIDLATSSGHEWAITEFMLSKAPVVENLL
jgi:hypothetical protein